MGGLWGGGGGNEEGQGERRGNPGGRAECSPQQSSDGGPAEPQLCKQNHQRHHQTKAGCRETAQAKRPHPVTKRSDANRQENSCEPEIPSGPWRPEESSVGIICLWYRDDGRRRRNPGTPPHFRKSPAHTTSQDYPITAKSVWPSRRERVRSGQCALMHEASPSP